MAQSFGFDLADSFAGDVELLADFFQRMFAFTSDAEAQADDLLLFGRKRFQDVGGLVADVGIDDGVDRRAHPAESVACATAKILSGTEKPAFPALRIPSTTLVLSPAVVVQKVLPTTKRINHAK